MNETETLSSALGEPGKMIVATMFFALGAIYAGMPQRLLRIRAWWTKRTIGADFIPSAKTVRMYRAFGAMLLVGGMILYADVFFR